MYRCYYTLLLICVSIALIHILFNEKRSIINHVNVKFGNYYDRTPESGDGQRTVDENSRSNEYFVDDEKLKRISNFSNLPIHSWIKLQKRIVKNDLNSGNCSPKFPDLSHLRFNNIYWQTLSVQNVTFYLNAAYYDDRLTVGLTANVRILAMIDSLSPPEVICQLWFEQMAASPIFVKAYYDYNWRPKWGNFLEGILQPFTVTCEVPVIQSSDGKRLFRAAPHSVSLVANQCDSPSNALNVVNNSPRTKDEFAVCVKALNFFDSDLSVRLVEWLEILVILGAKKVFFYELDLHPNISKVIDYYQKMGYVESTKTSLPGNQPNIPGIRQIYLKYKVVHKRQYEVMNYNDCLYRNINSYKYLLLLDVDEVIMPVKHENWSLLIKELSNDTEPDSVGKKTRFATEPAVASFCARNVYFFDNQSKDAQQVIGSAKIPPHLHMLTHVQRSVHYTDPVLYLKCFHDTQRVLSLHNHFPLRCVKDKCKVNLVNKSLVQLQHYRKNCVGELAKVCNEKFRAQRIIDTTIWKFKQLIIDRTNKVLRVLGLINEK